MRISTKTIVSIGMFAAIISVLSIVTIPMPSGVPVTLQTFAIALAGFTLGAKRGTSATTVYLLLGAVGIPVFAGMTGGISRLFGHTGGFLWGFLFLTLFCGIGIHCRPVWMRVTLGIVGLAVCHVIGVMQFAVVADSPVPEAFLLASAPYIAKDIVSVLGAYAVALPVRHALSVSRLMSSSY